MDNELLRHDLLYVDEHLTCTHYRADVGTGFVYREFGRGESLTCDNVQCHHLLMFLNGKCTISCNQFFDRRFKSGEMILIPRGSMFCIRSDSGMQFLDMKFNVLISGCDKLALQHYVNSCSGVSYDFQPVEIRYPLSAYIDLLVYCLQNGMSCAHLHEMKHRELFLYLRGFYTREEVVALLLPILSANSDFRSLVYELLPRVQSVADMAKLAGMTYEAFERRFRREFDTTAYKWLLKQICQRIVGYLSNPEMTIKQAALRAGFESLDRFSHFCKRHLGASPRQLIEKYREEKEIPQTGMKKRVPKSGQEGKRAENTKKNSRCRKSTIKYHFFILKILTKLFIFVLKFR